MASSVASIILFSSGLANSHISPFSSSGPIQMCSHTQSLIFHRKEEGLPPPCPRQGCLYLTFPLTHSLSLSFSLSLFFQHMPVVMLMAVMGFCIYVWIPPTRSLHSRRWCVITEQRWAEWSDWWGDCSLLTEVFVWPKDMCSHWHTGAGDKPHWAQTAVG